MANDLMVIKQSDVDLIAQQIPNAYDVSVKSHNACLNYGEKLLARIQQEGMSDELDSEASLFITKSKATVKKINEVRSPATKMFDQFKKVFTTMENEIDVSKEGSIPFQIQAYRNQYAAKKREEEERRRAEELRKMQMEQARKQYRIDCEDELCQWINATINIRINHLSEIFSATTLANYAETDKILRSYQVTLPEDWDSRFASMVRLPSLLPREECASIRKDVRQTLMDRQFREQYKYALEEERDDLLTKLPSKKVELEKIAAVEAANAAEAERIKAEMQEKERREAEARELERRKKEEEDRKAADAAKTASAVGDLFNSAASGTVVTDQSKTIVKKKVNVLNVEGFLDIFGMWWEFVGKNLTIEQLTKEFSKQITLVNKLANDTGTPRFIESEHLEYVEDVKAK
jgi:hypothetical protein